MQLAPLLNSVPPIPSHAIAAIAALLLGAIQFAGRKGTPSHRVMGWLWVALMTYVAISGFFIHEIRIIGAYSPIHLLSFVTLAGLAWGIWLIRRKRVRDHKRVMILLYFLALVITGLFTLLPGRVMHAVLFG